MITRIITSGVYDSSLPGAKIISFAYNLYSDELNEDGEPTYCGGFEVGDPMAVHKSSCDAWCDPLGAAYVSTMTPLVKAGTAKRSDLELTDVSNSKTETIAGVTRHTEYYKLEITDGD